jgi:hypothetical protein
VEKNPQAFSLEDVEELFGPSTPRGGFSAALRRACCAILVEVVELVVRLNDSRELIRDFRHFPARDRIVALIISEAGIDAIADAAETGGRQPGLQ